MDRRDYLGQSMMQVAVLPARAAYFIRTGSRTGFRRAVQEASTRWGGMTEPILPVPDDGEIPDELRETVAAAKVEAAVNVDVDDALAQRAADALGLPYVRIAKIDHVGAARFNCHPLHVNPPVQPSTLPVVAVDGAPLWQVAAAGFLSEDQAEELRPTALAVRPGLPDEYGRNQIRSHPPAEHDRAVRRVPQQRHRVTARGGVGHRSRRHRGLHRLLEFPRATAGQPRWDAHAAPAHRRGSALAGPCPAARRHARPTRGVLPPT